ncbi:LysR family transcriptional regulator [uncultured Tateyamaria sp.]|uniref:LysR family transcriptional regulator n=1 Tax=uncultured Tateyamaria sp. TaxID=455651 RepID=UPI002629FF44|nr:LysR family transcriptional regulator [uncultured Tateyamaria sp.]
MQLYQIRYFLAICQTGSVTHAARICNVSQPSMSRGIKKLEEELGEGLLVRDASGARLTPFGEEMQPYFENMLALEAELMEHAKTRQVDRGARLTIGVMCTLGTRLIQPYLTKLVAMAGHTSVEIIDASGAELYKRMEDGELDLCLSGYFHIPQIADAYPLYDERYVISFAKGHRFEGTQTVSITDLHQEPYVRRLECELRTTLGDMLPVIPEPEVDVRYESLHENMVQMMVLTGLGCSIHPETMPVIDGIYQRPFSEAEMARKVQLLVHKHSPRRALIRRILRMTEQHFGMGVD